MKVYAQRDALLARYHIVVDETESPYPRPTSLVGPHLVFNIIQEGDSLTVKLVEGGGFLMQFGQIPLRSLGCIWAKDADARPQSWEMTADVAEAADHAGSPLAEMDELEQRILHKFPQPKSFLVWRYDFVGRDGQVKRSNLPQPTMQSRFVKIDAVKRQREAAAAPHRILIEDDFVTPKKLMSVPATVLPPLEDDDHGQSFAAGHPRHVRPARGSTALFGEHPPY